MNIVEVQDNLKNFSQEQLVGEINKPSGMVPQFLVLTELGRRNRMKQDIEGRQAQNQPTVAQEVVSAAGVPQGGIMDMARSMAPKSSIEQNDGVEMMEKGGKPSRNRMDMLLAYLRSIGADEEEEVREATGGKSIAEMINFGGDYRPVEKKADGGVVKMAKAGSPTREVVYEGQRYLTDGSGRVFKASRSGSMRRGQEVTNPEIVSGVLNTGPNIMSDVGGIGDISANLDTFNPVSEGITPVIKPDPMFNSSTSGGPLIANTDDKPDRYDLPLRPLVKGPNNTLNQYGEEDVGALSNMVDGIGGSDPTIDLSKPEGSMISPSPRPEAGGILDGMYTQALPPTNSNLESFDGTRRSTSSLPEIEAMENIGKLRSQQLNNLDTTSNLPDFTTNKDPFTSFVHDGGADMREAPKMAGAGNNNTFGFLTNPTAPREILSADTFDNLSAEQSLMDEGMQITKSMDAADPLPPIDKKITDQLIDPTKKKPDPNSAVSSLESEIANMLKENEEDREQDKYLALAKMGLALMSSSNPTFGGALGEAGMAGVEDLQASRKSYRADKITLLDAQRKLEQARATATGKDKGGLSGTNIISRLNNIQTRKSSLMEKIAEMTSPSPEGTIYDDEQKKQLANSIEGLRREVADLSVKEKYFQSLLGGIGSLGVDLDATAN